MIGQTELAYCAGLIDGEGYIGIVKQKSGLKKRKFRYRARLSVQMKDEKTVKFIAKILNLKICKIQPKQTIYSMYNAITRDRYLEKTLQDLLPYLHGKKKQAKLLLEFVRLSKKWKEYWHGKKGFTENYNLECESYYQQLRKLNKTSPRIKGKF